MSNAPLDHRLVVERLKTLGDVLRAVGTASDYAGAKSLGDFQTPSAYALLAEETGKPNPTGNNAGRTRQMVESVFGVVIAVRNYRYDAGEQADELRPILDAIRGAIIGWTPPLPGARPCQFVTGAVIDSDSSTLLWGEVYQTQHSIGSTP